MAPRNSVLIVPWSGDGRECSDFTDHHTQCFRRQNFAWHKTSMSAYPPDTGYWEAKRISRGFVAMSSLDPKRAPLVIFQAACNGAAGPPSDDRSLIAFTRRSSFAAFASSSSVGTDIVFATLSQHRDRNSRFRKRSASSASRKRLVFSAETLLEILALPRMPSVCVNSA